MSYRLCAVSGPEFERGPNKGTQRMCYLEPNHEEDIHSDQQQSWPVRRCQSCGTDLDRPGTELCPDERDGHNVTRSGDANRREDRP